MNLIVKDKIHFDIESFASNGVYITTPQVSEKSANVNIKVKIRNNEAVSCKVKCITKVLDDNHNTVSEIKKTFKLSPGQVNEFSFDTNSILKPKLWSIDSPILYEVVTQLYDEKSNQLLDEVINPLGFRYYTFDKDNGFYLNGKPVKLVGTNLVRNSHFRSGFMN